MTEHRHVFVWVSNGTGRLVNRCSCGETGLPTITPAKGKTT